MEIFYQYLAAGVSSVVSSFERGVYIITKRRRCVSHRPSRRSATQYWILFTTASLDRYAEGIITEQKLITVCIGKSEAKVTNN